MNKEFEWTDFYPELANAIRPYANDRATLIEHLKRCYERINANFPKMDYDWKVRDIDPFTVFGLFNKGISNDNRIKLIAAIKEEFGIKAKVPELFNGVPVLNNMMACFFAYSNDSRLGKNDINNLWSIFELAQKIADGNKQLCQDFIDCWNEVITQFGVRWNLTMGLYWIRPKFFVNLDSVNREFIRKNGKLAERFNAVAPHVLTGKMPSGEQYIAICETMSKAIDEKLIEKTRNLPEFSYNAWKASQEDAEMPASGNGNRRVWLCAPGHGGCAWSECKEGGYICIGWDAIGDLSKFPDRNAMQESLTLKSNGDSSNPTNASLACWQFVHEIAPNDIVVAKAGLHKILGIGIVKGGYSRAEERDGYKNIRYCKWLVCEEKPCSDQLPMKTLTDITRYSELLHSIFTSYGFNPDTMECMATGTEVSSRVDETGEEYSKQDFLNQVFMTDDEYERIKRILFAKMNIILAGAPGVGKTFAARRLAWAMMGKCDNKRVGFVQFHQSYAYEDFICGYKPSPNGGFELRDGVFYDFCKKAENDPDNPYFFIIDEVNRGNLSKIFGELLMLIEADKRGDPTYAVRLAYKRDELFTVPKNLYIIGMMNTADRSLAMMDYALRRRFSFIDMEPGFDSNGFTELISGNEKMQKLVAAVKTLNKTVIEVDDSLGKGYVIGHSFFCGRLDAEEIVQYDIGPTLKEYWFDNQSKAEKEINKLLNAIR